tara:strand:+ start:294 stop:500 length:207 start_codon:yes stop_codon:yes gene_type:complete
MKQGNLRLAKFIMRTNVEIIEEGIRLLEMGASESRIVDYVMREELLIQSESQDIKRRTFIINTILKNQ